MVQRSWFLEKKAIINSTIQQSMPSPFCPKPVSLAPCMIVGWDCFWLLLCFKSCLYFLGDSSFLPTELNCKGTFLIGRMQLTKTCLRMAQIWSSLKKKKGGFGGGTFLRSLGYRSRLEITVIYLKLRSYYLDWAEFINAFERNYISNAHLVHWYLHLL